MKVQYELPSGKRKDLVMAIAELTGRQEIYKGAPTFIYKIGDINVDRSGIVEFGNEMDPKDVIELMKQLADRGFTTNLLENIVDLPVQEEQTEQEPNVADPETSTDALENSIGLTISFPLESVQVGNLTNLLEAKGGLIKKALGINDCRIEIDEDRINFPWFEMKPNEDKVMAYTKFIEALCKLSQSSKRISAKKKEVENEKYAFRCFLLRLGFIGEEYKADRKILLSNLEGSSAFKGGKV